MRGDTKQIKPKISKSIQPIGSLEEQMEELDITQEQTGSRVGELNKHDIKSWAVYTALTAISIMIPLGISMIGGLNLHTETIVAITFVLNSILTIIRKYTKDNSNVVIK